MSPNKPNLTKPARAFFLLIMAVAASLTVVTHIAQVSGMAFSTYAIIGVCVAMLTAVAVLWSEISKDIFRAIASRPMVASSLLMCCLTGGLLSLASHRPDTDDSLYVPNVIYYLAHPDEPMGFSYHFFDAGDKPFVSYHWGTSLPFEYAQGIVAYMGGIHFLTVYYLLSPALFGFMIPLVWFYVISRFSFPQRAAVAGTFIICLSLVLMGEQHRSFGNFAFNRIFQGKTVLFTIGIPMFSGLTIDFFRSPSMRRWVYLFVTSVAMVGFSSCSAMLIPLLAFVLAVACCVSYVPNVRSCFLRGSSYLCVLLYPALYAGSILLLSAGQLGTENPLNPDWPATFLGHTKFVFGGPVAVLFLMTGTILAVTLTQERHCRMLAVWILLLIAFYLNPLLSPIMIKYVTSQLLYWRLFYLYPFPLVVGLAGAALWLRLEAVRSKWRYAIAGVVVALFLLAHLPLSSSSVFRRRVEGLKTELGVPRYKVQDLALARKVLASALPAGTMLATPNVSFAIPMLSAEYPQMLVRTDGILLWMAQHNAKEEAIHRIRASNLLAGESSKEGVDSLVWLIHRYPQIRSIVANRDITEAHNSYLSGLLNEMGFTERKFVDNLAVFIRPDEYYNGQYD